MLFLHRTRVWFPVLKEGSSQSPITPALEESDPLASMGTCIHMHIPNTDTHAFRNIINP